MSLASVQQNDQDPLWIVKVKTQILVKVRVVQTVSNGPFCFGYWCPMSLRVAPR